MQYLAGNRMHRAIEKGPAAVSLIYLYAPYLNIKPSDKGTIMFSLQK